MDRSEAWGIVCEFVESEALRKHMLAVEASMRFYAEKFGEDVELWGVVGLLHDFDYEKWPAPPAHTREGATILRERGVDEEIVGAILSHAEWNHDEYALDRPLRKTLSAVDELSGFITAVALVRPTRLEGLEPKSVKKKLKTPAFAAAVSREDISNGAGLLGLTLDEHIANCIAALQRSAAELGLVTPGA
ncbi:MAG TPA: HDIG domain-containing protein [Phycisphaerae bacterium]|nr:HDIG domain-containing protein [Phycisphaerae bacterium]HRW54929.1 HDIG domain-containing protein [Phycisphaerae bacterium]